MPVEILLPPVLLSLTAMESMTPKSLSVNVLALPSQPTNWCKLRFFQEASRVHHRDSYSMSSRTSIYRQLKSKKSAYDFIAALCQRSDNPFPSNIPVSNLYCIKIVMLVDYIAVEHLLLVPLWVPWQCWNTEAARPMVSTLYLLSDHRDSGSVVIPCFSCPEPGFNMV